MNAPQSFTPGPWIVDDRCVHCSHGFVYQDNRLLNDSSDVVVEVNVDCRERGLLTQTDQANLRLIAAAPDLLQALQAVLQHCVTVKGMPDKGKGRTVDQQTALDQAIAAIAKASNP